MKSENEIKNPYNRNIIPKLVFKNIRNLIRLGKILNININLNFDDDIKNVSIEKEIELRTFALFQAIDALGNYSNAYWFLNLNRNQLIKLLTKMLKKVYLFIINIIINKSIFFIIYY